MQTHFNPKISLFVYCIMLVLQFQLVKDRLESTLKEVIIAQRRHCYCIYGRSEKQNGNTTMPDGFPVTFKCALPEYISNTEAIPSCSGYIWYYSSSEILMCLRSLQTLNRVLLNFLLHPYLL